MKFENAVQISKSNFLSAYKILNYYYFHKKISQIEFIKLLKEISSYLWSNQTNKLKQIISNFDEQEKVFFNIQEIDIESSRFLIIRRNLVRFKIDSLEKLNLEC